ncbi:MAG: hypothetical protein AAGF49_03075 [Pseudomonadota bacterium]
MTVLRIADPDRTLEFTFDDLVKFHGTRSICGLTVGYKVLQRAFQALGAPRTPLRREAISVATAFPGPGARDAFECVTRVVSGERYRVEKVAPNEQIAEAAFGAYYFSVTHGDETVTLGVRPGVVRDEFLALRRKEKGGHASGEELARFRELQWELSNRIRDEAPERVVNLL